MEFEWDEAKNAANLAKHGVAFEDAIAVFDGHRVLWPDARRDYGEARWITVGRQGQGLALTVVYTMRSDRCRIISVRLANRMEKAKLDGDRDQDAG